MLTSGFVGLILVAGVLSFLSSRKEKIRTDQPYWDLAAAVTFHNVRLPAKPAAYLFNSQEAWRSFKEKYHLEGVEAVENLVDFNRESFVLISGGSFLIQGNYLKLLEFLQKGDTLTLEILIYEAGKNCPRDELLNNPTMGIKIKKFSGRLIPLFQHRTYECPQNPSGIMHRPEEGIPNL